MKKLYKFSILFILLLSQCFSLFAQDTTRINRLSARFERGFVFPTNKFFKGANFAQSPINSAAALHLKYSFQSPRGTWQDAAYGSVYQGVGFSANTFFNHREIGSPVALYLFQGVRVLPISPQFSLNYEWNLGISGGWKPFDQYENPFNTVVGSKLNAYIAANIYMIYSLSNKIDISAGVGMTHFSNGNTTIPNSGVNILTTNFELFYNFGRDYRNLSPVPRPVKIENHFRYELLAFSGWKRRGIGFPNTGLEQKFMGKRFLIGGVSFAPLYVLSRKFRVGGSADLSFDRSVATKYIIRSEVLYYQNPPFDKQVSLGFASRFDYTMPYFTISTTLGYKVLNYYSGINALYQTFALKINVVKDNFINIGYSTVGFDKANYLMFGVGHLFH